MVASPGGWHSNTLSVWPFKRQLRKLTQLQAQQSTAGPTWSCDTSSTAPAKLCSAVARLSTPCCGCRRGRGGTEGIEQQDAAGRQAPGLTRAGGRQCMAIPQAILYKCPVCRPHLKVQVVGGLIQHQQVRPGKEGGCQRHTHRLPACREGGGQGGGAGPRLRDRPACRLLNVGNWVAMHALPSSCLAGRKELSVREGAPDTVDSGCVAIAPLMPNDPRWLRSACSFSVGHRSCRGGGWGQQRNAQQQLNHTQSGRMLCCGSIESP